MLNKIKYTIGSFLLKKQPISNRHKRLCNLKNAKSIGIVFELTDEKNWNIIWQIYSQIKAQNTNIKMLGFCLEKELPSWLPETDFQILTKKDLTFWLLPKNIIITDFCSINFDILIDFCDSSNIQNLYIVNKSAASLKVGLHNESYLFYYDFVIQKSNNSSYEDYVKNLLYYLTNINTNQHEN